MKLAFATLLLVSLVLGSSFLQFVIAEPPTASPASAPTTDLPIIGFCNTKCAVRCAKAGEMKRCLKYCGICCQECKCVPSGTYGNKSECPCYRDKLNSKDETKCP